MHAGAAIDVTELARDLRVATSYASRAGLLRDAAVLNSVRAAEKTLSEDSPPNALTLTSAINDLVQVIAPVTLADLNFGRDPFDTRNVKWSQVLQVVLTSVALITLVIIGSLMESLRSEQEVLQLLQQVQDAKPHQKLTSLRRMVQYEKPLEKSNVAAEAYYVRLNDAVQLNNKMRGAYIRALVTTKAPFIDLPVWHWLERRAEAAAVAPVPQAIASPPPAVTPAAASASLPRPTISVLTVPMAGAVPLNAGPSGVAQGTGATPYVSEDKDWMTRDVAESCNEERDGRVRLPDAAKSYPQWLKAILTEGLNDYCFRQKIFARDGVAEDDPDSYGYAPFIRDRVSKRVNWALPFLYGLLGSIIFLMRNLASVRTASMGPLQILMRLGLGGIAGIVIGWFSGAASLSVVSNTNLSLPFVLAFLTGYGIDALFNMLDKLNRTLGEISAKKA